MPYTLPSNEAERIAALRALAILDTAPEDVYDSFVRVACDLLGTPIGAVTLVDEDRLWLKASCGLGELTEVPRQVGFCGTTILDPGRVLCVPDLSDDERFRNNPLVLDGGMRFYAGAPLLDQSGLPLGALCVVDTVPRLVSPETLSRLQDLATGVSAALRLHGAMIRLDDEANRDPLTALGNRRAFDRRLERDRRAGWTLVLLDLDGFKDINDILGHPAGDRALQEVANRLSAATRSADVVFRLGGDEFAVLLPTMLSRPDAVTLTDRIHALLADTFVVDGNVVQLRASIGVSGLSGDGPGTVAGMIHGADKSLYAAKRAGRSTTRFADASAAMSGPEALVPRRRQGVQAQLRRALIPPGSEPFTLAFQAVTDVARGVVTGFEALIRWNPDGEQAISPGEFIPLAERTGLVTHIDRWVLRQACETAVKWPMPWRIGVNISAVTFGAVDLVAMVTDTLHATGLAPERLVIEMTETALAADEERVRAVILRLHALGVRIALDDFGGGHGSLTALRRYPFACIKIDRALVAGLDTDLVGGKTVRFIAELGALIGISVIAEGVERLEELNALGGCGVHLAQGFLLSQPVGAGGVIAAVRRAEQVTRLRPAPAHHAVRQRPAYATGTLSQPAALGSSRASAASTIALMATTNPAA